MQNRGIFGNLGICGDYGACKGFLSNGIGVLSKRYIGCNCIEKRCGGFVSISVAIAMNY